MGKNLHRSFDWQTDWQSIVCGRFSRLEYYHVFLEAQNRRYVLSTGTFAAIHIKATLARDVKIQSVRRRRKRWWQIVRDDDNGIQYTVYIAVSAKTLRRYTASPLCYTIGGWRLLIRYGQRADQWYCRLVSLQSADPTPETGRERLSDAAHWCGRCWCCWRDAANNERTATIHHSIRQRRPTNVMSPWDSTQQLGHNLLSKCHCHIAAPDALHRSCALTSTLSSILFVHCLNPVTPSK